MPIIFILLWSSGFLFVEMGLQTNNPLIFLMLRLLFAFLIITMLLLVKQHRFSMTWRQIVQMSITGIFLQGFYQFFAFTAISKGISPGLLAIVLGAQPIVTAIIMRQAMFLSQIIGLVLGLIGLALTVSNVLFVGANTGVGVFYCILSLLGITIGTILQKKLNSTHSVTVNLFIQYLASFLFIYILYLLLNNELIQWSKSFIIALSWMVLIVSLASTYLFYFLLKNRVVVNVTSYLYCVPPVTALMDYFVFHHSLSTMSILGMILVVLGLVLILKKPSRSSVRLSLDSSIQKENRV